MPNFKKSSRGFKMNRNSENPFNYGEGTGRKESPLKHDPEGYYASKEKEVAPKEASGKPVVNNEAPEKKPAVEAKGAKKNGDWRFKEGYQGGVDEKGEKTWTKPDGSKDHSYGSPHNSTWENVGIKAREWDEKSSNWLRNLWK